MSHTIRDLADSVRDDLTTVAIDVEVLTDRLKELVLELPKFTDRMEQIEREINRIRSVVPRTVQSSRGVRREPTGGKRRTRK